MFNAGILAREIKNRYGVPFVITEHFNGFYAPESLRPWQFKASREVFSIASKRIAVSGPLSSKLQDAFRMSFQTVPNMVRSEFFSKGPNSPDPSSGFVFINVSGMAPVKRLDLLLRAFSKVLIQKPQSRLVLVGKGPCMEALLKQAKDLGIDGAVRFTGPVAREEMPEVLSKCHCCVVSSERETFSVAAAEALAVGIPVVSTKCGGPESIVQEKDGYLVEKNDPEALFGAMVRVMENYGSFDGKSIKKRCMDRFGERTVTEKIIDIYEEILGR